MPDEKKDAQKESKKNRAVFRNAGQREYHIRKRPGQSAAEANFIFRPGMTVEALDEAEEALLASMSDLRDVAKETPALAGTIEALTKALAEEKEKNGKLQSDVDALQASVQALESQLSKLKKK